MLVVGAVITLVFGFLWVRDLAHRAALRLPPSRRSPRTEAEEPEIPVYDRSVFLSTATIGIGAAIGAVVTLPVLGFAVLPAFESHDLPGGRPRAAVATSPRAST